MGKEINLFENISVDELKDYINKSEKVSTIDWNNLSFSLWNKYKNRSYEKLKRREAKND